MGTPERKKWEAYLLDEVEMLSMDRYPVCKPTATGAQETAPAIENTNGVHASHSGTWERGRSAAEDRTVSRWNKRSKTPSSLGEDDIFNIVDSGFGGIDRSVHGEGDTRQDRAHYGWSLREWWKRGAS